MLADGGLGLDHPLWQEANPVVLGVAGQRPLSGPQQVIDGGNRVRLLSGPGEPPASEAVHIFVVIREGEAIAQEQHLASCGSPRITTPDQ